MPQRFERHSDSATGQQDEHVWDQDHHQNRERQASQIESHEDALDSVLDDIASTLESNAEEYVSSFVQQGGE